MADTTPWSLEIDADRVAWLTCAPPEPRPTSSRPAFCATCPAACGYRRQAPRRSRDSLAKASGFIAGATSREFLKIRTPEEATSWCCRSVGSADAGGSALPQRCGSAWLRSGRRLELALACTYQSAPMTQACRSGCRSAPRLTPRFGGRCEPCSSSVYAGPGSHAQKQALLGFARSGGGPVDESCLPRSCESTPRHGSCQRRPINRASR